MLRRWLGPLTKPALKPQASQTGRLKNKHSGRHRGLHCSAPQPKVKAHIGHYGFHYGLCPKCWGLERAHVSRRAIKWLELQQDFVWMPPVLLLSGILLLSKKELRN